MKFEQYLIESESEELKKQLKDTDGYLKAPNGKESNLPEKQWLIVRTKSFKNWFGDWENKPKSASKMVDDNGEPMIFYHGTGVDEFNEFLEYSYFTNDKDTATMYSKQLAKNGKTTNSVYEVFLNCRKPKEIQKTVHSDRVKMFSKTKTVDCLYNDIKYTGNSGIYEYVIRDGKQVKSINNTILGISKNIHESTSSNSFDSWFGNSKVVDDDGEPLVCFHGTRETFDEFAPNKEGIHFGTGEQAKMRNGKKVIKAYLSIQKLKRVKDTNGYWTKAVKTAKSGGYDGIVYLNRYEGVPYERFEELRKKGISDEKMDSMSDAQFKKLVPEAQDSYIVFEPNQIKSVDNKGSFDPESNNIYE